VAKLAVNAQPRPVQPVTQHLTLLLLPAEPQALRVGHTHLQAMPETASAVNVQLKLVPLHTPPHTLLYQNAAPKAKKGGLGYKTITLLMPERSPAVAVTKNLVTQMLILM
jgi:hypothetical protein